MTAEGTGAAALPRHEARRRALQVLYEADLLRREILVTLARAGRDPHADPLDAFARNLVAGVAEHRADIDAAIADHARGWSIARMPVVDRNILRLAAYELLFMPETPAAVVIDEAVELAKDLSTDDSPRYVNGVLSGILRDVSARSEEVVRDPSRQEARSASDQLMGEAERPSAADIGPPTTATGPGGKDTPTTGS